MSSCVKDRGHILCPTLTLSRGRPPGTLLSMKLSLLLQQGKLNHGEQWGTPIGSWGIIRGFGFMLTDFKKATRKYLSILESLLSESRSNLRVVYVSITQSCLTLSDLRSSNYCLGGRRKGVGQRLSLGKKQQLLILAERRRYLFTCVVCLYDFRVGLFLSCSVMVLGNPYLMMILCDFIFNRGTPWFR